MAKGYSVNAIKEKLIELLKDSKTGMSGSEIAEKLGINRITITKYLSIFSAEGMIRQKNIGNVTLWFIEKEIEQFQFPDDYFKIASKYLDYLTSNSENKVYNLIKNCIHSNAQVSKLVSEVIIPSIESIQELYNQGKIGQSEEKFQHNIISNSIQILYQIPSELEPQKNCIILAADSKSQLIGEASSASYRSQGWNVSVLGDMSSTIDVLFDLELQKFLGKVWKQKIGIMIVVVFSETEEGLKFFSESLNSVKQKVGKNFHIVLCGKVGKKTSIKSDFSSDNFDTILQWSQTIYENLGN